LSLNKAGVLYMQAIEPWYSLEEIARHLGVSKETIYRWLEHRDMPAHRMGKLWKFKPSEVDQWVKEGGAGDNSNKKPSIGSQI
jgi:excisionase family DNA binding protein